MVIPVDVEDLLSLDAEHAREDALCQTGAQHNDIVLLCDLVRHLDTGTLDRMM